LALSAGVAASGVLLGAVDAITRGRAFWDRKGATTKARRFGIAWLTFAAAMALHVCDEATHDFLSVYNPTAWAIRARLPWLPVPTFTFAVWLAGLCVAIALLIGLSPFAFRRTGWTRILAWPLGIVVGICNASLHLLGSAYYHRWMPGAYSSPFLFAAGVLLITAARSREESPPTRGASGTSAPAA
jgi:hypothetical protein